MTSNTGDTGDTGDAGNSHGWVLPMRADLPFVDVCIPGTATPLGSLQRGFSGQFAERNWDAKWYAFVILHEFVKTGWETAGTSALDPINAAFPAVAQAQVDELVQAARNERAQAMGEILAQDGAFKADFMGLLGMKPGSHGKTYRVLHVASLIGSFSVVHFKYLYKRVRPSQLCPALYPSVPVPGHASFPSGHSTQAHLMMHCIDRVLAASATVPFDRTILRTNLTALAARIARNREIAGLHYRNDSEGGVALAQVLDTELATVPMFQSLITEAASEWA